MSRHLISLHGQRHLEDNPFQTTQNRFLAEESEANLDHAPIGFLLTLGAGLSTTLGAAFVYYRRAVQLTNKRVLAAGLALAAGVMLYISLIEILVKSVDGYLETPGRSEKDAWLFAYLTFFTGGFVMYILDTLVSKLQESEGESVVCGHTHGMGEGIDEIQKKESGVSDGKAGGSGGRDFSPVQPMGMKKTKAEEILEEGDGTPIIRSESKQNSDARNNEVSNSVELKDVGIIEEKTAASSSADNGANGATNGEKSSAVINAKVGVVNVDLDAQEKSPKNAEDSLDATDKSAEAAQQEAKRLKLMGLKTALAIALHNFPEGLATFVATLDDVGRVF